LTNRVAAIAATVSPTNWMNVIRDEDVVALRALYPPTLRGDPGPDGQPELEPTAESFAQMKETVCGNFREPLVGTVPNRLRADLERNYRRSVSPNEALAQVRLLINQLPVAKSGQWERPLMQHFSFLAASQDARKLTQIAFDDAIIAAEENKPHRAIENLGAIIAISRRADEQPMLLSYLIEAALHSYVPRVVIAVLALTEPQPEQLLQAQSAISHLLSQPTLRFHIRGEQAFLEDLVRSFSEGLIDRQKLDAMDLTVPDSVTGFDFIDERLHRMRRRGWLLRDSTFQLRYYQALTRVLRESADGPTAHEGELIEMRDRASPRTADALQGAQNLVDADRRRRALLQCCVVALAAERYRRDRGHWPASVEELAPAYLSSVPVDPYDLKPLRYRLIDGGAVVYSVGEDRADDGGDVEYWSKQAPFNEMGKAMKDLGIRLFDPALRRLPFVAP
jgi:hypothetical protein